MRGLCLAAAAKQWKKWRQRDWNGDGQGGSDSDSSGAGFAWWRQKRGVNNVGSKDVMVTKKRWRQARRRRRLCLAVAVAAETR